MSRIRALLQRQRDEAGITLVEVTLTMLILAIVFTIAFDFLDRTSTITARTDKHARIEDDTQRVLRTVTQHLRGAAPIDGTCTASGFSTSYQNCVRFTVKRATTGLDGCTSTKFSIGLVGTGTEKNLVLNRTESTGAGTTCTDGTVNSKVVLTRVVNDGTQPLFTYYGSDGTVIDPTLNPTSVPKATTVKVSLRVRYSDSSGPIVLDSSAALRNNITR